MPGGEALARQFVAGQRFFREEFGVECREVWLPDSFGYTAALPQIARLAGARWFLTQKTSWNETNRIPHHTFWWEGIDGSRLFTHFPPVDTYNSDLSGRELARAERQFAERGRANSSLVPFGWGDGGGGPTREMLAAASRARSLEGSPRVEIASPAQFFARRRGGVRPAARVERGAVPGVPPRYLHLAGPDEAGQPAQRAPAARGRAVGDGGAPAARGGVPVRGARALLAHRPAAAVPRHPAGLLHPVGLPRRRSRVRRGRAGAGGGHRARLPRPGRDRLDDAGLQCRTVRRGGRPRRGRRLAGGAR